MFKSLLISIIVLSSFSVHAKRFANGYVEFELPAGWQCQIEGSEWVCQSENADRQKEAIIILAAKKRGPQDTLASYQTYLKKTKTYQLPGAKMQKSEAKTVKVSKLNNQDWVDALHLASELPGFYTRYLATVKADIGVAVTFSVTKGLYNAYKGMFDRVIASMRVFRQQNKKFSNLKLAKKEAGNFEDTTFVNQDEVYDIGVKKKRKSKGDEEDDSGLLLFLLAAGAAAFTLKKLKKGGNKKKKKKSKKSKKS